MTEGAAAHGAPVDAVAPGAAGTGRDRAAALDAGPAPPSSS